MHNYMSEDKQLIVELTVEGISKRNGTDSYVLVLADKRNPHRRLPIAIGLPEAQSIAIVLEHVKPKRPLTHDLTCSFLNNFGIDVTGVYISDIRDGIFYSSILCSHPSDNTQTAIDSRTSDAVAIAMRMGCAIFTNEYVMKVASVPNIKHNDNYIDDATLGEMDETMLNNIMQRAIAAEDYELASRVRDQLRSRS